MSVTNRSATVKKVRTGEADPSSDEPEIVLRQSPVVASMSGATKLVVLTLAVSIVLAAVLIAGVAVS